jgi:S1-C subfamily serine protease
MTDSAQIENPKPGDTKSPDIASQLRAEWHQSVANIASRSNFAGQNLDQTLGSGFIAEVDKSQLRIATDLHVVSELPDKALVRLDDGSTYTATIELRDKENDLAILRIDGVTDADKKYRAMPISANEKAIAEGEDCVKLSSRMDEPQAAVGNVDSYFQRALATGLALLPGENPDRQMIFVNGPSDSGDSGGAVMNVKGTVVGIDSAKGDGSYAATPSAYLVRDLAKLHQRNS